MGSLDRNADNSQRLRRNAQRGRATGTTGSVLVTAPLKNTGSTIQLLLLSTGGITTNSGSLTMKLDTNPGLSLSAAGLKVALQTNPGLVLGATGAAVLLADATLKLAAGGLSVQLNAAGAITNSTGLQINLSATGGLAITTNALGVKLADSSLVLAAGGVGAQLATNGGLELNTGLQVKGFKSSTPGAPADGDAWYDAANKWASMRAGGATMPFAGRMYVTLADSATVANTAASTDVESGFAIPASFFQAGRTVRITAIGRYSTKAAAPGTFAPSISLVDSSAVRTLVAGPTYSPAASQANARWFSQIVLVCRSTGATGTLARIGDLNIEDQSLTLAAGQIFVAAGGTPVTIDTTKTQTVTVSIQWSVADPANTAYLHLLLVEAL